MLLDDTYPADIRIAKEADALLAAGHEVVLLCFRDGDEPRRETIDGVEVIRRPLQHAHEGIPGMIEGARHLLTRVHRPWLSAIEDVVRAEAVDLLHPHDLPLVKTALVAGERRGLPVVADLHENWPEAVRQYRTVDRGGPSVPDGRQRPPVRQTPHLPREQACDADIAAQAA